MNASRNSNLHSAARGEGSKIRLKEKLHSLQIQALIIKVSYSGIKQSWTPFIIQTLTPDSLSFHANRLLTICFLAQCLNNAKFLDPSTLLPVLLSSAFVPNISSFLLHFILGLEVPGVSILLYPWLWETARACILFPESISLSLILLFLPPVLMDRAHRKK